MLQVVFEWDGTGTLSDVCFVDVRDEIISKDDYSFRLRDTPVPQKNELHSSIFHVVLLRLIFSSSRRENRMINDKVRSAGVGLPVPVLCRGWGNQRHGHGRIFGEVQGGKGTARERLWADIGNEHPAGSKPLGRDLWEGERRLRRGHHHWEGDGTSRGRSRPFNARGELPREV
jgi:hypothetical protein